MTPILTITLNPTVDLSTATARVTPGPKLRCASPRIEPGGGGLNVSRAITLLGGESTAFVALGGATGQYLAALLADHGIDTHPFPAPGDTRQSIAVTETASGDQFRFVFPGSEWPSKTFEAALTAIAGASQGRDFVVLSGSMPPGVPDNVLARVAAGLPRTARLIVDTSGAPLLALATGPAPGFAVLRMNAVEAEALAGNTLTTRTDTADFAQSLVRRGVAREVIIARGAEGSVLADADHRLFCQAAIVPIKSKVGAGDTFVGAYTLALSRGLSQASALQHGTAASSATVMTDATELCRPEDAERLIPECPVTPL